MQGQKTTFADFGLRLRRLIAEKALNEAEVARRTGITPQAINIYVRENRLPKAEQLYALSLALGVSMERLLTGQEGKDESLQEPPLPRSQEEARKLVRVIMEAGQALAKELEKF